MVLDGIKLEDDIVKKMLGKQNKVSPTLWQGPCVTNNWHCLKEEKREEKYGQTTKGRMERLSSTYIISSG